MGRKAGHGRHSGASGGKDGWNPEPGGTLGWWADSGGHNDIFQTVSDWPCSWEKDASERTCVYRYNVYL